MIGYSISIYKFIEDTDITSTKNEEKALVTWTSGGFGGLDWINNLVSKAKAEDLGGNGYPFYYKAQAQFVLGALATTNTQKNKGQTIMDDENVMSSDWQSKIDISGIAKLEPNQQLIIEAWDLS